MTFAEIDTIVDYIVFTYKTNLPFKLCEKLNINIFFIDLPRSTNGLFVKTKDNKKMILINRFVNKSEFTEICAHELAHAVLHNNTNAICLEGNTELLKSLDEEALYFSKKLLSHNLDFPDDF